MPTPHTLAYAYRGLLECAILFNRKLVALVCNFNKIDQIITIMEG